MSYILDALKKAQADESSDGRAALALELRDRGRQRRWQYLVFAALLLNAGVLVYLFGPWPDGATIAMRAVPAPRTDASVSSVTEPVAATAELTAAQTASAVESAPAMVPSPSTPPAQGTTAARPPAPRATASTAPLATPDAQAEPRAAPGPRAAPAPRAGPAPERISLAALPASARARFPALDFSTHLYASDAELRAVVMNGQRLQEGERYGELKLEEITETGVVLRFERYLVSVPVLDDWQ